MNFWSKRWCSSRASSSLEIPTHMTRENHSKEASFSAQWSFAFNILTNIADVHGWYSRGWNIQELPLHLGSHLRHTCLLSPLVIHLVCVFLLVYFQPKTRPATVIPSRYASLPSTPRNLEHEPQPGGNVYIGRNFIGIGINDVHNAVLKSGARMPGKLRSSPCYRRVMQFRIFFFSRSFISAVSRRFPKSLKSNFSTAPPHPRLSDGRGSGGGARENRSEWKRFKPN